MNPYQLFRPLIFKLDPEKAHDLAINFLHFFPNLASSFALNRDFHNLKTNIFGLDFSNPIGMAAGFDKNALCFATLAKFGFGFVEVGTVTPKEQKGNDKPRIFRLKEDCAIINRLGFNNLGADVFEKNLEENLAKFRGILGINIGKNKDVENALKDYLPLLERFYQKASYITVNISSPNTKNLRDLQNSQNLDFFLSEIFKKKAELKIKHKKNTPIFLKIAPDLDKIQQEEIAQIALKNSIDGLIISNTTIARPESLKSRFAAETGGLSGKVLFDPSTQILRNFYQLTGGKIALIGVGGVSNANDAYQKIRNGASLVQIYSAFIYQGFGLVENIKRDLSLMLEKDGFKNVVQAVGVDCN